MNFPFASRQGVAAIDGAEPATKATAANPKMSLRIFRLPYLAPFNWAHFDPGSKETRGTCFPPQYLKSGDIIRLCIERLGEQQQTCVASE